MSDILDRAQILEQHDRDVALAAVRARTHGQPSSGICGDCDDPIEAERLAVKPDARRCVFCQEAHERHQKCSSGVGA